MNPHNRHTAILMAATAGIILLAALLFTLSTPTASAQGETAQRTPRVPLRTVPAVEWTPENPRATVEALATGSPMNPSTVASPPGSYVSTMEAFATDLAADATAFSATAEAYTGELATVIAGYALTDEQAAAIDALLSRYDLLLDQDEQSITLYSTFSEATVNALISAYMENYSAYPTSTITVDFVPGGARLTITDVEVNGQRVTAEVEVTLSAANGELVVSVVSVTVNGVTIPPQLIDPYIAAFEAALDAALAVDAAYTVESVMVTDSDLSLVLTFYYDDLPDFEAMPAMVLTPAP